MKKYIFILFCSLSLLSAQTFADEQDLSPPDPPTGVFQDSCRLKLLNYAAFFLSLSIFLLSGFK